MYNMSIDINQLISRVKANSFTDTFEQYTFTQLFQGLKSKGYSSTEGRSLYIVWLQAIKNKVIDPINMKGEALSNAFYQFAKMKNDYKFAADMKQLYDTGIINIYAFDPAKHKENILTAQMENNPSAFQSVWSKVKIALPDFGEYTNIIWGLIILAILFFLWKVTK